MPTVVPPLIIQISELFTTENPWILVPLILLSSFLLARLIEWGGQRIVQRSAKRPNTDTSFNHVFFEEIYVPLYVSTGLLGIYLSLRVVGIVESSNILVGSLLTALVLLWLRTAIRLGNRWIGVVYASGEKQLMSTSCVSSPAKTDQPIMTSLAIGPAVGNRSSMMSLDEGQIGRLSTTSSHSPPISILRAIEPSTIRSVRSPSPRIPMCCVLRVMPT
ncbi:hypothetical protein HAPAU_37010 [Halalkalicoccus paucihalophilus]|uniref:Uncharacterized protein n=1 Tax=Halalkalicoccus paucihalophilus TaxID=1008153 RepID=A0A151A9J7_9EURY|nr:hypothetical protein HAPAU_37010 [Halalkalicoccus paucihalophilus]